VDRKFAGSTSQAIALLGLAENFGGILGEPAFLFGENGGVDKKFSFAIVILSITGNQNILC